MYKSNGEEAAIGGDEGRQGGLIPLGSGPKAKYTFFH